MAPTKGRFKVVMGGERLPAAKKQFCGGGVFTGQLCITASSCFPKSRVVVWPVWDVCMQDAQVVWVVCPSHELGIVAWLG